MDRRLGMSPPVKLRPCSKDELQATDLCLFVIKPSITATDPEHRFRCPVGSCTYIGATLGHQGDCLRHLLDAKAAVTHHAFLLANLVTFCSAEGKPLLGNKPSAKTAFAFLGGDKSQYAYMKVC